MSDYQKVLEANVALHARMAGEYSSCEPHFMPENVAKVEKIIRDLAQATQAEKLLDLGCGTGFVINIAKRHVRHIDGVDITQEMLDRVDTSGSAVIRLFRGDTGSHAVDEGAYDLVTAYSFLHHLFDIRPTLNTAFRALRPGGKFYADLEPNFFFWDEIGKLDRSGGYDPIITREIEMVTYKDEDIEKKFGVSPDVFNHAEYGKSFQLGFRHDDLETQLRTAGFTDVEFTFHWFVGQGAMINDPMLSMEMRLGNAAIVHELLTKALPLSRALFKYIGFVATK